MGDPNSDRSSDTSRRPWLAPMAMLAGVSAWLWPIGIGGRMPVGGDVTLFSIGLMDVLGRALKAGRLPIWNDLWGFGFPGLAESQMGVYYPPHLVLYGLFSTEVAYTASLVLHTYWAALGALWAARRFGVGHWGSALAGFCWAASGLFVIHLPHQWGYTTGSWLPWGLGLAWTVLKSPSGLRALPILAAVLTLQILPGHFQFAFETQVAVLFLGLWSLVDRGGDRPRVIRAFLSLLLALLAVVPLSAMQLWPTLQLARSASSQRTFEYLSAFPATPIHLVNYVAPNLFHLSPLWRPVAWDPFHAMPEEHRPYLGLVPLMLALGAIRRESRRDPATRALVALAIMSLLLSLGPYIPGFASLIRLPGFSFFRAPARWGLVTELALAILAGKGFDAWRTWPGREWISVRFVAFAAAWTLLVVATFELAFACTERQDMPNVVAMYGRVQALLPWSNDPPFRDVMATARRGPSDPLILNALIRQGIEPRRAMTMRLAQERVAIAFRELGESAGLFILLLAIVPIVSRRRRGISAVFLGLTFLDLMLLGRHRAVETAPIRPLAEQSTVLGKLASFPLASRTIDGLRNLPMVAGVAPVSAYRTLDRPALQRVISLASAPLAGSVEKDSIVAAMRALGVSVRVLDPFEPGDGDVATDPALASWLFGEWGRRTPEAARFRLWRTAEAPTRAWFVSRDVGAMDGPNRIFDVIARARPVEFVRRSSGEFAVNGSADQAGTLIVSVLDDPGWTATMTSGRSVSPLPIRTVFRTPGGGGWQAVSLPASDMRRGEEFSVRWTYRDPSVMAGGMVSAVAWLVWLVVLVRMPLKVTD